MHDKKRMLIPGIAAGVFILILANILKPSPTLVQGYDQARLVEVSELQQQQVAPVIQGFGRVEPKHVWQAVAEVTGKVIYRHPQLETGRMLPADTLVLEIDPLEYELKLAQAVANLNATEAKLTQLDQQQRNLETSLAIEQKKTVLVEQEYERKQSLQQQNLISSSELESQKQSLLAQTKLVEDLQSSLKLLPDDRKVTQAQASVDRATLQDAERRLAQTKITLPFDARVSDINIEQDQVVANGAVMIVAHQLGTAEIKAELSLSDMRTLVSSIVPRSQKQNMPSIEKYGLQAQVQFGAGEHEFIWPAKVTRVAETVNPTQGTIGVYLEVEQDFHQLDLLAKPPLTKGMFVAAKIYGGAKTHYVVPEQALHGNSIYIMSAEQRLQIVTVDVLFRHEDKVAIDGEIAPGALLVLNDLIPAIEGMSLKVAQDDIDAGKETTQ
ncbi:HlyD family efflux transporter periplasmic adaptor subunit [Shewanella sp. Scap07]|uniref:efflux RND transporter periplasmic adaptor subunit n=1 Tax=Shewanella sp. Scap07 TaxID=2589987 RepID=UPI0015C09680|nr:HlyD family efflux transporter periplasmic adaptor subunit [Shewanella sp. Scap07]QLE87326.1 HlyD family efflux transporter periplasmic adaptor subunit [Shewanella sp. Scap07]